MKTNAPLAYQVIRAISFTQEQYNSLINSYAKVIHRGHSVEKVACEWVQDNEFIWTKWIPDDAQKKTTLYIGGIFPVHGSYWKQDAVAEGKYYD